LPAISLALVLVATLLVSRPSHAEWFGEAQAHMGTEVSVYLWHDDPEAGQMAVDAIFAEVVRLDRLMSTYKEDSRISEINRNAADGPVAAGDELFHLIRRSLDISVLTHGAFDITYDSVGQHYDFRERRRPDAQTVAEEVGRINYELVETNQIDTTVRFLQQGVRINLGGIAKGYAVERGIAIARRHGVRNARVTAGGDTRLLGDRLGQPWMVGIQNPRNDDEVAITIPLENEAISTSGDYERFFIIDGKRYHHIFNPRTGYPAEGLSGTTLIHPDPMIADAWNTAIFVLGPKKGLERVENISDMETIMVKNSGEIIYSTGLENALHELNSK